MKKRTKRIAGLALSAMMAMSVIPASDSLFAGISAKAATDMFGDINSDGIIDGRDATMVLTYYAKSSTGYSNSLEQFVTEQTGKAPSPAPGGIFGDITGDGIIDGRDATILLTYYAKISTGYTGTLEQFVAEQTGNKPSNSSQSSDADVVFDFGNYEVKAGGSLVVSATVDSKGKAISAMDVRFAIDSPLKITDIDTEIPAFNATAMTNMAVLGANFKSLDSQGEPLVPTSDPVFNLAVDVPASAPSGTYKVGFGSRNEVHKSNNGTQYTVGSVNGNITVKNGSDPAVTTTQATVTTAPASSTNSDAEVVFDFGNTEVDAGKDIVVSVKVDSKGKAISAMDVRFAVDSPLKITEISEEVPAFNTTAMTNMAVLGANFKSLDSQGEPLVPSSDPVFYLGINVPASTPSGTYNVGFGSRSEVHKSNNGTQYTVGSVNGKIKVNGSQAATDLPNSSSSNNAEASDIIFDFGNTEVEAGKDFVLGVKVDSKGKAISAMDVRFAIDSPLKITEISEEIPAFGVTAMTNMAVLGANFKSLDSQGEPLVPSSEPVFCLGINVPASTPAGTYNVGFGSRSEVHKSNNGTQYTVGSVNGKIKVTSGQSSSSNSSSTPSSNKDVTFDFGNYEVNPGNDVIVSVKMDTKGKAVSAVDARFMIDSPLKITEIAEEIPAFNTTAMTNLGTLGANFKALDSKGEPLVPTSEPVFYLNVNVPASTSEGTYHIGFGSKNEVHKSNDGSQYSVEAVNGTIKVTSGQITSSDTPSSSNKDVVFDFGNNEVRAGQDFILGVKVDSKGQAISAMDVKFAIDSPLKITEISEEVPAFGVTAMTNLNVLGMNFKSLSSQGEPLVPSNEPVFYLGINVPASTNPGTYKVGFGEKHEVHKSNDGTQYAVQTINGNIYVS